MMQPDHEIRGISMAIVSASILAADFVNLERDIHNIEENKCDWIHFDVMDGTFVPNLSFGLPSLKCVRRVTDMTLDVHLMVGKPIRYVERFIKCGADWLTIHLEADTQENTIAALKQIRQLGRHPGISIRPATTAEEVEPYLQFVDLILVMTVEPGFGGQKFREDMMPKLHALRQRLDEVNPTCMLSVDGGIDTNTASICRANGAEVLVTGSAYFKAPDRAAYVRSLQGKHTEA